VPALPSSVLEPLGSRSRCCCPPARTPIRRIADHTCSATTLRRRRDEWISAGLAEQLCQAVLAAYDRMHGLELEQLAVDGCTTKAPCGPPTAGEGRPRRRP
jgi:hypothetical protein